MTAAYAEAASMYVSWPMPTRAGIKRSPGRNVLSAYLASTLTTTSSARGWTIQACGLRDGKPFVFACQPYHLSLDDLREIVRYCDAHNLDVHICSGWSWHYPGRTLFVELSKKPERRERLD